MSREAKLQLGLLLGGAVLVAASVLGLLTLRERFLFRHGLVPGRTATPFTEIRLREPRQEKPPVALILHGLTANRQLMISFAESLAGAGLDCYLVDLPGHGDSAEPFAYSAASMAVREALLFLVLKEGIEPQRIVLVGHSMGGHLALESAWRMPQLAATVAISGMPRMGLRRDRPRNLLFFTASFDFGRQRRGAFAMFQQATGQQAVTDTTVGDFALGTARRLVFLRRTGHTGLIYTTRTTVEIVEWVRQSVPGARLGPPLSLARLLGLEWLGVVGLILLFAPLSYGLARLLKAEPGAGPAWSSRLVEERPLRLFLFLITNAWLAVSLLRLWNPLSFTRIFTGSYLAGFLLVQSVPLLVTMRRGESCPSTFARGTLSFVEGCPPARAVLKALIALAVFVFYAVVIGGWFLNWQMTDAWPTSVRLGRMALVLPFLFAYFQGEEALLRGLEHKHGRRAAWMWLLRLRVVELAALWYGVYVLASGQVLVVLIAHVLVAGTLLLFWLSSLLYRRFGSLSACALFDAILAAWFFGTVLPML